MIKSSASHIETALIKGAELYHFRVYTGRPISTSGARQASLESGDVIGVRKSSNGREVRLVLPRLGPKYLNLVHTLTPDDQQTLSKNVRFMTAQEIRNYRDLIGGGIFD